MSYFGIPIRNGLPIGLGSVAPLASGGGSPFSPLSLFSGGAPGAWYDPSDLTTLFQDSAGTTPVTAVEQPVGLMLDKSQGLVLGPELVTNGDFSGGTTTGWTADANAGGLPAATLSVVGGRLRVACGTGGGRIGFATQSFATIIGRTYRYRVTGYTGTASFSFRAGSTPRGFDYVDASPATGVPYSAFFTATTTTTYLTLVEGSTVEGQYAEFDNISVKELPGNHAFQATSASRPVLSARYNLLTKTEQFDDGTWQKVNVTAVNTSATTDPLGGNTADKLYPNSSGATRWIYQVTGGLVLGFYKWSIRVKAAEKNIAYIDFTGGGTILAFFNLSVGTVGTVASGYTAAITSLGNGWYECSGTNNTATAYSFGGVYGVADANGSTTVTANGTDGIYIWGASLVPSNQSTLPYQRVNTATDYNTTGFLPYLKFDGVDDSLSTNSISFTSTDKMSVFAGVRKLSDAAGTILFELSATSNSNNGTFAVTAPASPASNYGFALRGDSVTIGRNATTYSSPITNTLTAQYDIGGSDYLTEIGVRVNGVVPTLSGSGSSGAGNFGNYPLYIGRRNNASLPFNGQMYSMIIVGKAVTAGELSSTETYVNQKTGAY